MTLDSFCLGALETNAYLLREDGSSDCWVFDCPDTPDELLRAIQKRGLVPRAVYLTHAHADHMAGLGTFHATFPGVPVYQHVLEREWLADPALNLSAWMGEPATAAPAAGFVGEGDEVVLGSLKAKVLHVPGHSPGSVAFWFQAQAEVISGDVLFRSGVGRWDFPGCDRDALRSSLDRLCSLPDETRVRPGHGGSTTVGRERASNPYLRSDEPWE